MSEKRNAPVETAISNKGNKMDGAESSGYDSILTELFGQVCVRLVHLNEKHCDDGYGCYQFSYSDAAMSVLYSDTTEYHSIFHMYRSEIERVGMHTALRSLIEILNGEGDAE